jgi:dolichyl-phosphate-mannose-protein mannosyltransferase
LEPNVPYVAMRLLPAMLGIFLIPISYLTIRLSGFSSAASFLVAALIIFGNNECFFFLKKKKKFKYFY